MTEVGTCDVNTNNICIKQEHEDDYLDQNFIACEIIPNVDSTKNNLIKIENQTREAESEQYETFNRNTSTKIPASKLQDEVVEVDEACTLVTENNVKVKEEIESCLDSVFPVSETTININGLELKGHDVRIQQYENCAVDIKTELLTNEIYNSQINEELKIEDELIATGDMHVDINQQNVQCPFCNMCLGQQEYLEYHLNYCTKKNSGQSSPIWTPKQTTVANKQIKQQRELYKCSQCPYKTAYKADLKDHTNQHYKVKAYNCRICHKKFNHRETLKLHLIHAHVEAEDRKVWGKVARDKYKCPICKYETARHSHFKRHLYTHVKAKLFKCSECEYATNFKAQLKLHVDGKHCMVKQFKCSKCPYETAYKAGLQKHMYTHEEVKRFKCTECDQFETNYKAQLTQHVNIKHRAVEKFKCPQCNYETPYKSCLKKHSFLHGEGKQHKCSECTYETNSKWHLKQHVNAKHCTVEKFNCTKCDYETTYKALLKTHMRRHEEVKRFKCAQCDFATHYNSHLKRHTVAAHSTAARLKCPKCDYETAQKYLLKNHMYTHEAVKRFKCSNCDFQTNYKSHLEEHMNLKHREQVVKYKCKKCDYETAHRSCLRAHLYLHEDGKRFQCSVPGCAFETNYKSNLTEHMDMKHSNVKKYQCTKCEYGTAYRSSLMKHLFTHETEKRHKCPECKFASHYEFRIKKHVIAMHSQPKKPVYVKREPAGFNSINAGGVKTYKCTKCEYETPHHSSLRNHRFKHEEVKRFKCDECEYETNFKADLSVHASSKHSAAKQFKCAACPYETASRSNLRYHLFTHETVKRFKCSECDYETNYNAHLKRHASSKHDAK